MILPKGTVDSTRQGGEGKVRETITELIKASFTGYLLIQGHKENEGGAKDPVTGQLVVKEGKPILCESIVDRTSEKGDAALFSFLSVMMDPQTKIEVHSKIDVGPPFAFFKECRMNKPIDLDGFLKHYRKHQEEIRKKNEERTEQEKRRKQMMKDLEEWSSSGYQIGPMDEKKALPYADLMNCYNDISSRINRSREIVKWLSGIKDVDLTEQVEKLRSMANRIDDMPVLESSVKNLQSTLDLIVDKRQGIMKWVNLWKEEGFSTEFVEEKLNGPLEAAWDATIFFMDAIQKLKEYREELDAISKNGGAKFFSKEIAEIEFILNDPNEIPNAERQLQALKDLMESEKAAKQSMIGDAHMYKAKGFSIKGLVDHADERAEALKKRYDAFKLGVTRIGEITNILQKLDRRDLSVEIETLKNSMMDPFQLDSYEASLNDIQERIVIISGERASLRKHVDDLRSKGYQLDALEGLFNGPIEPLKKGILESDKRIDKLVDISREISGLDRRWQDDKVAELERLLKQPEKVTEAKDVLSRIKARIAEREQLREKVKHDLQRWKSDGFLMNRLEDVIEDDISAFSMVHEDMMKRITSARELLKDLGSANAKFFAGETDELRSLLKDPFSLDRARQVLTELKAKISFDTQRRQDLRKKIEDLKRSGYKVDSLKDLAETPSSNLDDAISDLDDKVSRLKAAYSEVDKWDATERSWLHSGIEELRKHLMDLGDLKGALDHHSALNDKLTQNMGKRVEMRERVKIWKEAGYSVSTLEKKMDRSIEDLTSLFEETYGQVIKLEGLQERFDQLDVAHFKKEAEDLEFKLNDPGLVDEIGSEMDHLETMIKQDREKRSNMVKRIDSLLEAGFSGAEKLKGFMDHDMSILELEVKNFEKETQMFLKYMETTGFRSAKPPSKEETVASAAAPIEDVPINAEQSLQTFIVGNSNRFAAKAVDSVIGKPGQTYNPLWIFGASGMGKTHLLNAVGNGLKKKHPKMRPIIVSFDKFGKDILSSTSGEGMKAFRKHYGGADVLLIDDLEGLNAEGGALDEFESIVESMMKRKGQVVLTASIPPNRLPNAPERLKSMLDSGLVVEIKMPSDDIKRKLITASVGRMGLSLSENLLDHIGSIDADMRTFERILKDLKARSEIGGRQIDVALIDEITYEVIGTRAQAPAPGPSRTGPVEEFEGPGPVKETASFVCNACNATVPGDSTTCPNCGASFEDSVYVCPKCSAEVPFGSSRCPSCQTEFAI